MKAIAAVSKNGIIGVDGRMPWHWPEDFKWFKDQTLGNTVVLGRKTFEGMPILKNRSTIVLTRDPDYAYEEYINSKKDSKKVISEIIENNVTFTSIYPDDDDCVGELFIAGGYEIYKEFLPMCESLLLSRIPVYISDDSTQPPVYFPPFNHLFDYQETKHFNTFDVDIFKRKQ